MPCNPLDVSIDPTGPSGPAIPGFGPAFSLNLDGISDFLDGFPEDLLELLDQLSMLIPPGLLQAPLNPNFGKDAFDAILKLIDQFMPFLMLYKFFLPILNLLICIIEVLCAMNNPFKLIRAIRRLFRRCIPDFLNLFPIFALIMMIISLLLLLLALIEYLIAQILKFIELILRNILALEKAIEDGDANAILAITTKIGGLLCFFQNLFILLAVFNAIFQIFRDLLRLSPGIPPCDNTGFEDPDGCCTPDVCPSIVLSDYTRVTGSVQYLRQVAVDAGISFPSWFNNFNISARDEGWFIYDSQQTQAEEFINIVDAWDIPDSFGDKPSFFPTDGVYNENSNIRDVPYVVDVKFLYNPFNLGRAGQARYVEFKNCIVTKPPTRLVYDPAGNQSTIEEGVLQIVGGLGYEEDGTVLLGFESDGTTQSTEQATLNNFIHLETRLTTNEDLFDSDGYLFSDVEYTFRPNFEFLFKKQLVSAGCEPNLSLDKLVVNNAYAGNVGVVTSEINNIINTASGSNSDGVGFPDPQGVYDTLFTAINALRDDMTPNGVNDFSNTVNASLDQMRDDANWALGTIASAGVSACDSTINLSDTVQFTSKPIIVKVSLNERNGTSLVRNFNDDVARKMANKLVGHTTFGLVSKFTYDGTSAFTANLTSDEAGTGKISVSFDNEFLCINNIPEDLDVEPSIDIKELDFEFILTSHTGSPLVTGEGKPRRDAGDVSRDGSNISNE